MEGAPAAASAGGYAGASASSAGFVAPGVFAGSGSDDTAPAGSGGGPNPTVAGILAGIFSLWRGRGLYGAVCEGVGGIYVFLTLLIVGINIGSTTTKAHYWRSRIVGLIFFHHLPTHRFGALGQGDSDGAAGAGSFWSGGDFWWWNED